MQWTSNDNSTEKEKIQLRIMGLPKEAHVLDLFCGTGKMYEGAYKNRAASYKGIDNVKVHDAAICQIMNNVDFVRKNDISKYNYFDLDAYGSPWGLMYLILRKLNTGEITMIVTDGLVMHQKVDSQVTKFVSATEGVPRTMKLPGINRFYVDMFATMLLDIRRRTDWETYEAKYFNNSRGTVYYWLLKMRKQEETRG